MASEGISKSFSHLEDALKYNLDVQKKYPDKAVCTDIFENSEAVNIQVCKSGMVEGKVFHNNDLPGLEVVLRFMGSSPNVNQYWDNFNHSELFRLFKTNEINLSGVKLKECYYDYAQDYIGAAKMISTLIKEVYRFDVSPTFTYNTWFAAKEESTLDASSSSDEVSSADIAENKITGRIDYGGGFYYIGEIKDGKAEGKGAVYSPDDTLREEGTFRNGELNGYGISYVDGEKFYEGHFEDGERSGVGALYAMGILQYEGEFLHDERHGKGTQWWPLDHSKYVGDFKMDKRTGKGVLYIDGKKRYEGEFVDGKFHGKGTYYDDEGNVSYSGEFVNNKIAYEAYSIKGNNWVSVTSESGKTIAESYKLTYDLQPHNNDLKDSVELSLRVINSPLEQISLLGIYVHFVSKGKNAFIMGGFPAELRDGRMTFKFKDGRCTSLDPMDISHDMKDDMSIDEVVCYPLEKKQLKDLCDGTLDCVELEGWSSWPRQTLLGKDITFLLRSFWNGTFGPKDYVSYLQNPSYAPKLNNSQGCYIATAIYGSYDCSQVWTLRRFRDDILDRTLVGRCFIKLYYSISPYLVKKFGDSHVFKKIFKAPLDHLVSTLKAHGIEDSPYSDKY